MILVYFRMVLILGFPFLLELFLHIGLQQLISKILKQLFYIQNEIGKFKFYKYNNITSPTLSELYPQFIKSFCIGPIFDRNAC